MSHEARADGHEPDFDPSRDSAATSIDLQTRPTVGLDRTEDAMTRNDVLRLLRRHKATVARRFGVIELALYGSFARDRASDDSDVDILVRFDAPGRAGGKSVGHASVSEARKGRVHHADPGAEEAPGGAAACASLASSRVDSRAIAAPFSRSASRNS